MLSKSKNTYEAYLFGPLIFPYETNEGYGVIAKSTDLARMEIVKSGQRSLHPSLKIGKFSCSVCKQDYEKCAHEGGEKYGIIKCEPIIDDWDPSLVYVISKAGDNRTRITDLLEIFENNGLKQYVWYGFNIESKPMRVTHINIANSNGWLPHSISQHFIKFFGISNQGVATHPPNPEFILRQGYRVDLTQTPTKMYEKKKSKTKKNNSLYLHFQVRVDRERYDIISIDNICYLYDKFDKILLPYTETLDFLMSRLKGGEIYWIRPKKDDIRSYVDNRIPKIAKYLGNRSKIYLPVDKSERFLAKLTDQYVSNFVILNVDLKGSTELTTKISLSTHSLLIGLYSREMALIVDNYHGFVLKYLGDGIIAYFPLPAIWGIDDNAVDCAFMMKTLIERGMNEVLRENNMPTLSFRIGLDTGEAIVTTVGDSSQKLHKDLIGNTIDLTTKIQGVAPTNNIAVGSTLWKRLGVHRRKLFSECTPEEWNYEIPTVPDVYQVYCLTDVH